MARFRKKPVEIEAEQFWPTRQPWPAGVEGRVAGAEEPELPPGAFLEAWIETLEGRMQVRPGDWVITGVQGERYPCRADIFEATYEPVDEAP